MFPNMPPAFDVGFYFTQGALCALVIAFLFAYVVRVAIDFLLSLYKSEYDVQKYVFTHLPYFYKSMSLKCDVGTSTITATAKYFVAGQVNTRAYVTQFKDTESISRVAADAQLYLMTSIKKEHDQWIQSLD